MLRATVLRGYVNMAADQWPRTRPLGNVNMPAATGFSIISIMATCLPMPEIDYGYMTAAVGTFLCQHEVLFIKFYSMLICGYLVATWALPRHGYMAADAAGKSHAHACGLSTDPIG